MSTDMQLEAQERMFHRIRDFRFARNARQALGFYLFHLLIGVVGFMLAVMSYQLVFGLPQGESQLHALARVSSAVAMGYVGWLSYKLLAAKNLLGRPVLWFYGVLGILLAIAGMLLGLLVPACFSILRPREEDAAGKSVSEEEQP